MSTKDALRQLRQIFSQGPPPVPSLIASTAHHAQGKGERGGTPFPSLTLPSEILSLLDTHLSQFAASFPLGGGGGYVRESEGEKERSRWREGLLEIWSLVEPLPGTESDPWIIARVSAFLVLLERMSASVGDDEASALVGRRDMGLVWWKALLRRTMLGTAKGTQEHNASNGHTGNLNDRSKSSMVSRKVSTAATKGTKVSEPPSESLSSTMRPLTVSREALYAAIKCIAWGMCHDPDSYANGGMLLEEDHVSLFARKVLEEYEERAMVMLKGTSEGYGVRNLEECIIGWGEKHPRAFFAYFAPLSTLSTPARLPYLSLLLAFLTRHSGKAYHAMKTPLLTNLDTLALLSFSSADVGIAIKCLAVFLVTLPVIIGEEVIISSMAVYARAICWEDLSAINHGQNATEPSLADNVSKEESMVADASDPPDPFILFTVLYGLYPCNFTALLKDAIGFLKGKWWKSPHAETEEVDFFSVISSGLVRERSKVLIRQHTLSPALLTSDLMTELVDTRRWERDEAADVMAACDRNVVQLFEPFDYRGDPVQNFSAQDDDDDDEEEKAHSNHEYDNGRGATKRNNWNGSLSRKLRSSERRGRKDGNYSRSFPATSSNNTTGISREGRSSALPARRDRTQTEDSIQSLSRSRSPTPHMPATSHFTNFQALQSNSNSPMRSDVSPHRSTSRFRSPPASVEHSLAPSLANSRRSSIAGVGGTFSTPHSQQPQSIAWGENGDQGISHLLSSPSRSITAASAAPISGMATLGQGLPSAITTRQIMKLETDLLLLTSEVNFQTYLKHLHIAHMGTLHREKVLESGAEAERQSLYRTIRTLRAQLSQTKGSLDKLRSETGVTKANWTAHIDDLREKLKNFREQRMIWDKSGAELSAQVDELKEVNRKQAKELESTGAAFFDLQQQVQLDSEKLNRISEYEARIETLTRTLTICDGDLAKYVQQRKDMEKLVQAYHTLQQSVDARDSEIELLRGKLRQFETDLISGSKPTLALHSSSDSRLNGTSSTDKAVISAPLEDSNLKNPPFSPPSTDEVNQIRKELARLRARNIELEEIVHDSARDEIGEDGKEIAENGNGHESGHG